MALYDKVARGNIVTWTITFLDGDGDALSPVSAVLSVNFLNDASVRESVSIDMTEDTDGAFNAQWDSVPALPGRVYWSARSATPNAAEDGYFELIGNLANLALPEET